MNSNMLRAVNNLYYSLSFLTIGVRGQSVSAVVINIVGLSCITS
jgi:hypothetical protein